MAKTGFFKGKILSVNPNQEWVENIIGEDAAEWIEDNGGLIYTGTTKDIRWCNLDFYIEDNKENIFK
jgi:hypothetical protein